MSNLLHFPKKPFELTEADYLALDEEVKTLGLRVLATLPDKDEAIVIGAPFTLTFGQYADIGRLVVLSEIRTNHLLALVMDKAENHVLKALIARVEALEAAADQTVTHLAEGV